MPTVQVQHIWVWLRKDQPRLGWTTHRSKNELCNL